MFMFSLSFLFYACINYLLGYACTNATHCVAVVFGYDEETWGPEAADEDICPDFCFEYWADLTDEQKLAAWAIGYNESRWNES